MARDRRPESRGQRDLVAAWDAALAASGLPVAGLDAPRPKPRFVLAAPLGADVRGDAELADLWLVERLPRWRVREALTSNLPAGYALVDLYDVWLGESALPGRVAASVYRATTAKPVDGDALGRAAAALLAAETLPRDRRKGEATVSYDLRPFLAAIDVRRTSEGVELRMTLRHDPARGIGRPDEALAALGEALGGVAPDWKGLVRESLILAEPPPPEPPAPRLPRRPRPSPPGPDRRTRADRDG